MKCFLHIENAFQRSAIGLPSLSLIGVGDGNHLCAYLWGYLFFSSFISLIADGPHHYHPACGHKGSYSHLSPVHALQFFYRDASSALLQLVNQWLNFTYSRSHAFRYERKNTNPTLVRIELGKNRTHDFRTSRCAVYLLDHSGDERQVLFE